MVYLFIHSSFQLCATWFCEKIFFDCPVAQKEFHLWNYNVSNWFSIKLINLMIWRYENLHVLLTVWIFSNSIRFSFSFLLLVQNILSKFKHPNIWGQGIVCFITNENMPHYAILILIHTSNKIFDRLTPSIRFYTISEFQKN